MLNGVKLLGSEIALSTANSVGLASVARCFNNTASQVTLTRANTGGTIGTVTMAAGEVLYVIKSSPDTLACSGTIRAVSVAYSS